MSAWAMNATITLSRDERNVSSSNVTHVTLRNAGERDIYVLGYQSVLDKPNDRTTGNWLQITDAFGNEVPYVGRFVSHGAFEASAFVRVPPRSSVEGDVELSREYDLPPAGTITVSTTMALYDRVPGIQPTGENEDVAAEMVKSNELTFHPIGGYVRSQTIASTLQCTAEQLGMTRNAISAAQAASQEAAYFLGDLYYADPIGQTRPAPQRIHMKPHRRYTNWFGAWDDAAPQDPDPGANFTDNSRVDQTVTAVYVRLLSGARTVCDECKGYSPLSRAWAEGSLIHLCPVNFTDPITGGITSQAGTIVHEVSHQADSIARATVDLPGVNNRNDAHRLERPKAVQSAANYEYFITDTQLGR
jgi:hypothetical protein